MSRPVPPELTVKCPRQPAKPASWDNINVVMGWASKAAWAGSACRALSDKQSEWIANPPT